MSQILRICVITAWNGHHRFPRQPVIGAIERPPRPMIHEQQGETDS